MTGVTRRRQEKSEARMCFAVELAEAPGLGKNQIHLPGPAVLYVTFSLPERY
jgi:hypothetical protein